MKPFINKLSDFRSEHVGSTTRIWQYAVVQVGARKGNDGKICAHVLIESDVVIGDRVTVKSGGKVWDGLSIEDDVFIGPNVTFTNDPFPRSKQYPDQLALTTIKRGESIGRGGSYSTWPDYWRVRHDWRRSSGHKIGTCGGCRRGQSRTNNQLCKGAR